MKLLFIGLGSIGKRHLRNVTDELNKREIKYTVDALRHGNGSLGDCDRLVNRTLHSDSELDSHYDAIFVTNPTSLHRDTVERMMNRTDAMFIEKPIFMTADENVEWGNGLYYVACPLRRSPVLTRLKELVPSLRVIRASAVCSSYLPEWRATDYRQSYSAIASLGGGVRLDLVHEWDYIKWLFGTPNDIISMSGKFSDLEMDCDDTAVYAARYDKMLLTLIIDYVGKSSERKITLVTDEDVIVADILKNEIKYLKSDKVEKFEPVDIHRIETDEFLDMLTGNTANSNDPQCARESVRLALI